MRRLIFRGQEILRRSGEPNPHRLSLKARVSYPPIERLVNRPETVQSFDMANLAALLTDGLGLSEDEAMNLRLGDIFEIRDV